MNENEFELSNKQIETIALNIYKDIQSYIKDNINEFKLWKLDCNKDKDLIKIIFSTSSSRDIPPEYEMYKNRFRKEVIL